MFNGRFSASKKVPEEEEESGTALAHRDPYLVFLVQFLLKISFWQATNENSKVF